MQPVSSCFEIDSELAVYLINLDCSQERLRKMSFVLKRAGLEFQRIQAVDGRGRKPKQFEEYSQSLALQRYGRPISGPEVGCFLSHRRSVEAFLASSKQFALVFEDDIDLPPEFMTTVHSTLKCLQETMSGKWDVVNLGNPPNKYSHSIPQFLQGCETRSLRVSRYFPLGTFALLWSRSGAESFLEKTQVIYQPVDQYLRDWCARDGLGLALSPELVSVDRSQSYIRPGWSDRLKMNFLRYWAVKNWRLLKNNYRAWQSWKADDGLMQTLASAASRFGANGESSGCIAMAVPNEGDLLGHAESAMTRKSA